MEKLWKGSDKLPLATTPSGRNRAANKRAAQDVTIIRLIYIITHHTNFKLRTLHNFIFIEKRLANWARLLYKAKPRICFHNEPESRSRRIMEKLSRKRRENFNPKVSCLTSSPPRQKAWISRRSGWALLWIVLFCSCREACKVSVLMHILQLKSSFSFRITFSTTQVWCSALNSN